nr:hypothetical protein [Jordan Creek virus]
MSSTANVAKTQSASQAGDQGASVSALGNTTEGGQGGRTTLSLTPSESWDYVNDNQLPTTTNNNGNNGTCLQAHSGTVITAHGTSPLRLRGGVETEDGNSNEIPKEGGSSDDGGGHGSGGGGRGGRGGNGHDPHPGGTVGGGASSGQPGTINEGAAALLAKMFTSPIENPTPSGVDKLPCDTEELVTSKEHDGTTYSPVMWADPLIPINVKSTATSAIDRLPATGCSVNNHITSEEPQLTEIGRMLKGIIESEGNPSLLRAMMPQKDMKDTSALMSLAEAARRSGFLPMSDVAPLVRLGMLIHCMADPKWLAYVSSNVTNMCANGYADINETKAVWSAAPGASTATLIGSNDGSSTLYWRTIQQYCRLINGTETSTDTLKTTVGDAVVAVDTTQVKFIPVKMSWRGQSWLGPYILAHTTTKWWNHSIMLKIPVKIHDQKNKSQATFEIHSMPKAATVVIPGVYKYICLVIVDVVETSFPAEENYYLGSSYKATFAGNIGFSSVAYKLLGRNVVAPAHKITPTDCYKAWRVMCENLLSHVNPLAIEVQIATLATSRFCGYSVWPDEAKAKKKKAAVEEYERFMCEQSVHFDDRPESFGEWMEIITSTTAELQDMKRTRDEWLEGVSLRRAARAGRQRAEAELRAAVAVVNNERNDEVQDPEPENEVEPADVASERDISVLETKIEVVKAMFDKWVKGQYKDDATTDVDHVSGVTCFDPNSNIVIGDHTIPDWNTTYNSTSTMPDRVKFYTWWRVDPLHRFAQGLIESKDAAAPVLSSFVSGEMQYELSEAVDLVRIMSYAGIYVNNTRCSLSITCTKDILHRSLGYGSLLLGVTELWRLSSGLSVPDHNGVSSCKDLIDPQLAEIFRLSTINFLTQTGNTNTTAWSETTFNIEGFVKSSLAVTEDKWLDHWYGGVVPWWFVQAVLLKMDGSVSIKCNQPKGLRLDYDEKWNDEYGYHLTNESCAATDLAVLTSSIMYEKKVQRRSAPYFTILTPDKDSHKMSVHWTSWYYNEINDVCKKGLRSGSRVVVPDYDGVVQLNALCHPVSRRYKGYVHPEAFVSNTNRYISPLDYTIRGGLKWPDPPLDWLKQGLFAVAPHLLRLDVVGAVGAALDHVNKSILEWLNSKVHGQDTFRD